ncbi:folate-binding protein YgfZ [Methylocystis sp. SC2]|uniref:CAF17-like 4Fe-4S cluster assembly/insertion protein YgfZ n=1 Tax=Methylocystis sp. (strain SC2) TaxID=187303 RepID=UPI00027AEBCC|nr:folate-binding protein YgfZ [Methylocystis sp. SC2]CCJ08073.1 Folate-binding protein YgfZ [Methylocystis sp. SC2]
MSAVISLQDRGIVEIAGADATKFLHNLVTNDIAKLAPGEARFCALLAPQGKILVDFLVFAEGEGESRRYLLDCPIGLEPDLLRRLAKYKLRAAVSVTSKSDEFAAFAVLGEARPETPALAIARDPRAKTLGWRLIAPRGAPAEDAREDYEAARIAAGVPQGGVDFAYGAAFPHEANMDLLAGVDFTKGCYIGQEVVSRTKHRNLARKRVRPYHVEGAAPVPGTKVMAGEIEIGVAGSHSGDRGLALIRLDRLADARAAGTVLTAGGASLEFDVGAS